MKIRFYLLLSFFATWSVAKATNIDTRSDSIDIINTSLFIDVSDFSARVLHGRADINFTARANRVNYIKLDLLKLIVDSIKSNENRLSYSYDDSVIDISLPKTLTVGKSETISIFYHGKPIQTPGDFGGFYWDDKYAFNIGVSFLAVPHNYGKIWFPCFDNFVERSTYHFAITTDPARVAVCNGQQDSVVTDTNGNKTWYWTMNDGLPAYLVCMAVSDYTLVRDSYRGLKGNLPILLAARAGDTTSLKLSFAHLKNALSIFENRFGPYEFNKVGYSVVPFSAGAMEHATNIAYMQALVDGSTKYESVMAHELSHHWFGDMVTIDNEADMWLHEGWASYCEDLFYEELYGRSSYRRHIRATHEDVIRMAHIVDSSYRPLSPMPSSLTYSNYSVYEKGADRVHTLRGYMGDSLFFSCMRGYIQQYKWKPVNSYILRDYLIQASGIANIKDFFDDWVFDGGFPDFSVLRIQITKNEIGYNTRIVIRQRSDHASHLFINVPLEIACFDSVGHKTVVKANISGPITMVDTIFSFYPVYISLDFDEKISDAVTDTWMKMTGYDHDYDFGVAKMTIHLKQSADSSLVRIEHHFVAPDTNVNLVKGLRLSNYRYWNVDGIWASDFKASATIEYNGSDNAAGHLDNALITSSEENIVMVYRRNPQSPWEMDKNVTINMGVSRLDKIGSITIKNLRKGDYALAVRNAHNK